MRAPDGLLTYIPPGEFLQRWANICLTTTLVGMEKNAKIIKKKKSGVSPPALTLDCGAAQLKHICFAGLTRPRQSVFVISHKKGRRQFFVATSAKVSVVCPPPLLSLYLFFIPSFQH